MLPLSIHFTDTRILHAHRPSFAKNQQSANNTRLTSNIQQNSIAEISKKHQFPEKTDIGTVKMVKDHCEATAR